MAALARAGQPAEAAGLTAALLTYYPDYPANGIDQLWLSRSASLPTAPRSSP